MGGGHGRRPVGRELRRAAAFAEVAVLATLWSGGAGSRRRAWSRRSTSWGAHTWSTPASPAAHPDMFIGGNDAGAKQTVTKICAGFGWATVVDLGGIEAARLLEPMCIV